MTQQYRSFFHFLLFVGLFGLLPGMVMATHIVGGEIELQYLGTGRAYTHRINLNLYFDQLTGNPGAEDATVSLGVFRKRDNAFLSGIVLPQTGSSLVASTLPNCTQATQSTRLIRYGIDVTLNPQAFNDPGGYYISWERCCRNAGIVNINLPGDAADAFYLEFPAISATSTPLYNSSPVFNTPKGDYICLNRPFTFDFSAKDPDGDSLVYTMVTPYNGFSDKNNPIPGIGTQLIPPMFNPGPYPTVNWSSGYSATNAIPGSIPLQVNPRTGILTVTASRAGLYVFSVEVVEYRKGVAIGRVRRDYQLKAIDCPVNDPPVLLMKAQGASGFYKEGTLLTLNDTDNACLTLYVTDPNANQTISIANGSGSLSGLAITPGVLVSRTGRDTTTAQFCFDACALYNNGKAVTLQIKATDDGCPQGLTSIINIQVLVNATVATKPAASTDLRNGQTTVTVGTSLTFNGIGKDSQNGAVTIQAVGRGFDLASAGMSFSPKSGTATVSSPFVWKPTCSQATRTEYLVDFIAINKKCTTERRDTTTVRLTAQGVASQPPSIRTSLASRVIELVVTPADTAAGGVRFTVFGNDPDKGDTLKLTGTGRGFNLASAGMVFTNKTGRPELQSPFSWQATCATLQGKSEATFTLDFANTDGSCQPKNTDTTSVVLKVRTPEINYDEMKIPNTITPNNDGKNDYFGLMNVPVETCTERFERVTVYNRWGKSVFDSVDRAFRWYAPDYPAGVYYYTILYGQRSFKGTLMIMR
ncbi:T9SS type B sorting domain-containing protein [Fibrella forsythiae]|uniref:Gliding motility-associated C-terminal domain-containing protein n=1 Tax=Fibrella forsythiae TaxID=2817061 RepID=A0ABS3JCC5_9BACT|nr:gliding motility-associated C-terminal domain-containing protein [Fibrella forsythiae]MBO0947649.1 gliding motility-associated C-terminal domain-containing protein [Fibrella forsythiae]